MNGSDLNQKGQFSHFILLNILEINKKTVDSESKFYGDQFRGGFL